MDVQNILIEQAQNALDPVISAEKFSIHLELGKLISDFGHNIDNRIERLQKRA